MIQTPEGQPISKEQQIMNLMQQVDGEMGNMRAFQMGYQADTPKMNENHALLMTVWKTLQAALNGTTLGISLSEDESGVDRSIFFDPENVLVVESAGSLSDNLDAAMEKYLGPVRDTGVLDYPSKPPIDRISPEA